MLGAVLERVRILHPFVLRSVVPPLAAASGRAVRGLRRLGPTQGVAQAEAEPEVGRVQRLRPPQPGSSHGMLSHEGMIMTIET